MIKLHIQSSKNNSEIFRFLWFTSMVKSFKHAVNGIIWAFKNERNMKIHGAITVLVLISGFVLKINQLDWIILILCIGLVLAAELINTAIEKTLDLLHPQHSRKVKVIKDVSAGAVLILSFIAAVIGVVVFVGYLD